MTIQDKLTIFEDKVANIVNQESLDNLLGIPDYIIAKYLSNCIQNLYETKLSQEHWCVSSTIDTKCKIIDTQ